MLSFVGIVRHSKHTRCVETLCNDILIHVISRFELYQSMYELCGIVCYCDYIEEDDHFYIKSVFPNNTRLFVTKNKNLILALDISPGIKYSCSCKLY